MAAHQIYQQLEGRGQVVFAGRIWQGREAVKVDTVALDAFGSPFGAQRGTVTDGVAYASSLPRPVAVEPKRLNAQVALVSMVVGDRGDLVLTDQGVAAHQVRRRDRTLPACGRSVRRVAPQGVVIAVGLGDVPEAFARARLGVLPLGTVNVFARELALSAA